MSFHLDYYKSVDPDKLYQRGSMTIIYSHSGEWYESLYPETHKDMLHDEDVYLDVFAGDPEKEIRQQYGDKMVAAIRQAGYRTRPGFMNNITL